MSEAIAAGTERWWATASALSLLAIAVSDMHQRRVSNALCAVTCAVGLCFWLQLAALPGLGHACAGAALGLVVSVPFYLLQTVGAADCKVCAAFGAWVGPHHIFAALGTGLLLAGLFSLHVMWQRRIYPWALHWSQLSGSLARARRQQTTIPLATALALGMVGFRLGWTPLS